MQLCVRYVVVLASILSTASAFSTQENVEEQENGKPIPNEDLTTHLSKRRGFAMTYLPHQTLNPSLTSEATTWKLRELIQEYLNSGNHRQQSTSTPSPVEPVAFFFKPPSATRFTYDDARWPLAPAASTISTTIVTPPSTDGKRVVVKKRKIKKPRAWSPPSAESTIEDILQQLKFLQQQPTVESTKSHEDDAFSMQVGISHKGESGYRVPNDLVQQPAEQNIEALKESFEREQADSGVHENVPTTTTANPIINNNIEPPNPVRAPPLANELPTSSENNWPAFNENYFAFYRRPRLPEVMTGNVFYFNEPPNATVQPATTAFFYKPHQRQAVFTFLPARDGVRDTSGDLLSSDSTPPGFARHQPHPVAPAGTSSYFMTQPSRPQFVYEPVWASRHQGFPSNQHYHVQGTTPAPIFVHETIRPGPIVPIATIDHLRQMFGQPITPHPHQQYHHPAPTPSYAIYRPQQQIHTTPVPIFHEQQQHFENVLPGIEPEERPTTTPAPPLVIQRPNNEFWRPLLQPFPVSAGAGQADQVNEIRQQEDFIDYSGHWESKKVNKLLKKQTKKMMKHLLRMKPELGRGIPGVIGVDYPAFGRIPTTEFRCSRRMPGYYADQGSHCQGFHLCHGDGRIDTFLCPNGTIFNQEKLVCDWWYSTDCERAHEHFVRNRKFVADLLDQHSRVHNFGNAIASQTNYVQGRNEQSYYPYVISQENSEAHPHQNLV